MVGKVQIGGGAPIVVQSMLTSDTRDAEACVKEALGLAEAGCQIVRVTAQTRVIAENLQHIRDGIRAAGCDVPLVADIHFKPDAAMEAVKWVEKVRVNPGNYADKKKFAVKEYTDDEYAAVKTQAESEDAKRAVVMTVAQSDGVKSAPLKLEGKPLAAPADEEEAPAPKAKAKAKPAPVEAEEDAEPEVRKTPAKTNAVPAAKSNLASIVSDWDDE